MSGTWPAGWDWLLVFGGTALFVVAVWVSVFCLFAAADPETAAGVWDDVLGDVRWLRRVRRSLDLGPGCPDNHPHRTPGHAWYCDCGDCMQDDWRSQHARIYGPGGIFAKDEK